LRAKTENRKLKMKREGNFTEGNEGNQGVKEIVSRHQPSTINHQPLQ
jgi:hypothetical protein